MSGDGGSLLRQKIAYFSMEIALSNNIHTYSGGLGVLAGDTVRSSADLKIPLVAVSLISKKGYFRQELTRDGRQIEHPDPWNPSIFMEPLPEEVTVQIQGRNVRVKAWLYSVKSITGGEVDVYLLDTDVEGNTPEDREITSFLYGGDERYRIKQEIVLGIGGFRILEKLGIDVRKYHMNEGHSSFLALELLRRYNMNIKKVRNLCVFTTHTPVEAAHDKFSYELVQEILGEFIPFELLRKLGGQDRLNMTLLALNLSNYVNGVAKRHKKTSKEMFPSYEIHAITNGIHSYTWTCESFRRLYDKYLPGWAHEPELLVRADIIPDDEIWKAHVEAKKLLIDYVNKAANIDMNLETLTIGFARRATEYKRHSLVFSDLERLRKVNRRGKIQLIFAGKAHPRDEAGKKLIEEIFTHKDALKGEIKIAYLENYDLEIAAKMVSGVDVWLNTPLPPMEASGTSGMKAAHNGVINFSVLDGWWIEGWIEGVTGWAIGPAPDENLSAEERKARELDDLYGKLEYVIIPLYYTRRDEWIKMMKNSITKIACHFNSHRMMHRYVTEAYL
ncbi:MAG: alpha-glucan family phosphorylase [Nitrososphaerota archaeon]|nr:alpha-glucan family phosphorylase [Candidatus Bathyarchaeota archaeon]MDW8023542.1 alpha-glucan family phosphorylase [Nitrososphaerota archaeon]